MFKFSFTPLLGLVTLFTLSGSTPARASMFSDTPVPHDRIIAIAAPYNEGLHQLLVIQQVADDQACWRESNPSNGPIGVDPLLAYFDFTGICGRSTDSNGYSVRLGGQDLGWRYSLQIVKQDGDLRLMGMPTGNRQAAKLDIGRVGGWQEGFVKIQLNPGWRMTQRTYLGEPLGHIYFSHDQPIAAFNPSPNPANVVNAVAPITPNATQPSRASVVVPTITPFR
jgi:hypothetical protein